MFEPRVSIYYNMVFMVVKNKLLIEWAPNQNGASLVFLKGSVDHSNCAEFEQSLKEGLSRSKKNLLVVNCEGLEYISSAGISMLLESLHEHRKNGLKIALVGLNKRIRDILDILGLDKLFILAETQEEALKK